MVENKSLEFSIPLARFTAPDLGYSKGKYVSIFAPGVSFSVIPGYIIGKMFGLSQVGTFAMTSLFALLNFWLIKNIATRVGAHPIAAIIAGLTFLFATPAFPYAVSLYQHHISTFMILLAVYTIMRSQSLWAIAFVWFLIAASVPIDNPNIIFMIPIAIYSLLQFFIVKKNVKGWEINMRLLGVFTFIAGVIPIVLFMWFNLASHGDPLRFSGTLPSVKAIDAAGKPAVPEQVTKTENRERYLNPETQQKPASGFFKTRNILNGFYVHFVSRDRGILYYTPIMLIAFLGLFAHDKKYNSYKALLVGIIGFNILLYSLWGDPWGGWAFASRYLIPSYAVLSIFLAIFMTKYIRRFIVLAPLLILFAYSVSVNTLGAITTNRLPPEGEAKALSLVSGRVEKFSYDRNIEMLQANKSKSYIYQAYINKYMSAWEYYVLLVSTIVGFSSIFFVYLYLSQRRGKNHAKV